MKLRPLQTPRSTYRLQLGEHMRFADARQLVAYLSELGIGAAYLSPFFRARQGSTHGYDVVDHQQLDPRFGVEQDFQNLAETLSEHDMGLLIDIVPNHMGIDDPHNLWWQDVLENGPGSTYAKYFDIDWNPPKAALQGKVLLPTLGDQFGKVLEDQEVQLRYEDQRFVISYYDRRFPTDPKTWVPVLKLALEHVATRLDADVPERMEQESIVTALEHLPERTDTAAEAVQERYREKEVARRRLSALVESSADIQQSIEHAIADYNGRRGEPASFDKLEALLSDQPYRLCHWRVATDEINYRRFFDVDSLAAIRVEEGEVFDAVHQMVLRFVEQGWVTGLRIDHADGLLEPQQYLTTLSEAARRARGDAPAAAGSRAGLYIVVEKILAHDETLPDDWPIDGTTGYGFLNLLNGAFVDRRGAYALRDAYARFIGHVDSFSHVLYESKRAILATSLSSELYMLSHRLDRISEQHRWSRDFTRLSLYRTLREVVACFPVYRTYIRPETEVVREEDRQRILTAVRIAKRRNPAMSPSFFDFIASVLLLEHPDGLSAEGRDERRAFVLKFQQITPPVTAKGLEDTAFYRYYPLASLNEVGGDPTIPGTSIEQYHRRAQEQMARWPHNQLTTGTHDTKRGEDFRARLNVLSEVPEEWEAAIGRWREMNAGARVELDGAAVPDANEEYLIYQTLVGTWPVKQPDEQVNQRNREHYVERIVGYLDKALREAKLHTSWLNPYLEYDQAVAAFIRTVLDGLETPFAQNLEAFADSIADAGFVNSLAQTLIKICTPGVPDFWQGAEFWDFNLVDPDNRRPVDFEARRRSLADLASRAKDDPASLVHELLERWPDERIKLFVIWRALQFRREHSAIFDGDYQPLTAEGPRKTSLCAFVRFAGGRWAACIVPRLACQAWRERGQEKPAAGRNEAPWPVGEWWRETVLQLPPAAPTRWRHVLTDHVVETDKETGGGRVLDAGKLLREFPVALLSGETTKRAR